MSKYATPAKSEVVFAVTVSDYNAITASEINAGTDLTTFLRGLPDLPRTANLVDVATIDSKFEKRQVGTRGGDTGSMELLRDDSADTAYTTLTEDTSGFLILGRKGWATAGSVTTGEEVDVYPITIAATGDGTPGRNEADFFVCEFAITNDPSRGQTI